MLASRHSRLLFIRDCTTEFDHFSLAREQFYVFVHVPSNPKRCSPFISLVEPYTSMWHFSGKRPANEPWAERTFLPGCLLSGAVQCDVTYRVDREVSPRTHHCRARTQPFLDFVLNMPGRFAPHSIISSTTVKYCSAAFI